LRQLLKYGLVGGLSLGVDVSTFMIMRKLGCDILPANILARFAGAVTAFSGNFVWTFSRQLTGQSASPRIARYVMQWVIATCVSTLLLNLFVDSGSKEFVMKICIELLIVGINFLVAKYWVFR
jgi:putative flippase GtrA